MYLDFVIEIMQYEGVAVSRHLSRLLPVLSSLFISNALDVSLKACSIVEKITFLCPEVVSSCSSFIAVSISECLQHFQIVNGHIDSQVGKILCAIFNNISTNLDKVSSFL